MPYSETIPHDFLQKFRLINWNAIKHRLSSQGVQIDQSCILLYGMFLFLGVQSQEPLVPNQAIDLILHAHIHNVEQYETDLENLGVAFRAHVGAKDERDRQRLLVNFGRTKTLFQKMFGDEGGELLGEDPADCEWLPLSSVV